MIKHWPSTDKGIALFSAEAELWAAARALGEAKGLKPLGQDFGKGIRVRVFVGAHAAIGLGHRSGLGQAWHTETAELWIHGALRRQKFEFAEGSHEHNPAGLITKPVP